MVVVLEVVVAVKIKLVMLFLADRGGVGNRGGG